MRIPSLQPLLAVLSSDTRGRLNLFIEQALLQQRIEIRHLEAIDLAEVSHQQVVDAPDPDFHIRDACLSYSQLLGHRPLSEPRFETQLPEEPHQGGVLWAVDGCDFHDNWPTRTPRKSKVFTEFWFT